MTTTDTGRLLPYMSPPTSLEEASARISNLAAESYEGLVGMKFLSMDQLRMAMAELGTSIAFVEIKGWQTDTVKLYEGDFNDKNGKKWWLMVRELTDSGVDVIQVTD